MLFFIHVWHPHFHLNGIKKYLTWPSLLTWRSLPHSVGVPLWAWSCRCWRWPGSCSDWAGTQSWTHGKAGLVLSHTQTHTPQSLHIPHSPTPGKAGTSWLSLHIKSWTLVRAGSPPPPTPPSPSPTHTSCNTLHVQQILKMWQWLYDLQSDAMENERIWCHHWMTVSCRFQICSIFISSCWQPMKIKYHIMNIYKTGKPSPQQLVQCIWPTETTLWMQ